MPLESRDDIRCRALNDARAAEFVAFTDVCFFASVFDSSAAVMANAFAASSAEFMILRRLCRCCRADMFIIYGDARCAPKHFEC